jgi:hypothetical protein
MQLSEREEQRSLDITRAAKNLVWGVGRQTRLIPEARLRGTYAGCGLRFASP